MLGKERTEEIAFENTVANGSTPRILVIDDNKAIHDDIRKTLRVYETEETKAFADMAASLFAKGDHGVETSEFEVDAATQGQEGLRLVQQSVRDSRPFCVAFIDMRMPPGWNGIETATRIWDVDPDIQIVFCTAYSDFTWSEMTQRLGANDRWVILRKPFDPIEVLQLSISLSKKWNLLRENRRHVDNLLTLVQERTKELDATVTKLNSEIEGRLLAESKLMNAQKLEALGRLAAGIAHEINNPLAFLLSNLDSIEEEIANARQPGRGRREIDLDQVVEDLGNARIGSERIKNIVRDVNLFCRFDDRGIEVVDIPGTLELSLSMVDSEIRSRARVIKDFQRVPPVRGIQTRIEQVFVNLLLNAAHAIPEGKTHENEIRITTRVGRKGQIVVEISDTGAGIAEEDIDRIFDPFFSYKPSGKGMGLKLSICQGILKSMGGELGVKSQPGKGTTMRVVLPVKPASDEVEDVPSPAQEPRRQSRSRTEPLDILVVDDEPLVAQSLKRNLRGHRVVVAFSGREALELWRGDEFDVVFCDLMMDDLTGMDFYEELQRSRPGLEEKVIFMTGGAFTERAVKFLEDVPNRRLSKPFDIKLIKELLEGLA